MSYAVVYDCILVSISPQALSRSEYRVEHLPVQHFSFFEQSDDLFWGVPFPGH